MPLYEYECENCEHRFEVKQSFNANPGACCPECRSNARRVFTSVPVIFKGSGFYITDHRKEKPAVEDKKNGDKPSENTAKAPELKKKQLEKTKAAE